MALKKLLSVLVVAGLFAGLGCGGDSGPAKDKKDAAKKDATEKKDSSKPDMRKDL
jgi:hypothetical protein